MAKTPKVFISYSHRDKRYVEKLLRYLKVLDREVEFDVWSDRKIVPGQNWHSEITRHIEEAQIAILLVSTDYLASDWISKKELPALLEEQAHRGLRILPLVLKPSLWKLTPLAYYRLLPEGGRALSSLSRPEQDRVLVELVEEVRASLRHRRDAVKTRKPSRPRKKPGDRPPSELLDKVGGHLSATTPVAPQKATQKPLSFFISHSKDDGDFAENLKFTLEKEGFFGWIDTDVLQAGTDWRQEIDDAILSSTAVILVLSPESKQSEYVTYEWAFALGSGLRIVPLMLKDTPIHPRLEIFQYLDFTNRRARPWARLLSLLRELSTARKLPTPVLPPKQKNRAGKP